MRILISGASGLVGSALTRELRAGGDEIVALGRSRGRGSAGNVDQATWSPERGEIDAAALEGLDAVVHLAGESVAAGRWSQSRKARIRDSRVQGTRLLASALAGCRRPPAAMVCASAIGFYGSRGDLVLTEQSEPADDFLGRTCVEWEAAAHSARQAGIRVTHARFGIVLSGRGGALSRMLRPFRLGLGGRVGSGSQYMSWLSLEDAVGVLRFALDNGDMEGPVNAVAPVAVTNAEFTRALARALGRPALLPLPATLVRLLFGEMGEALLLASARVQPLRLQQAGYVYRHPELSGALQAALKEAA